MKYIVSCFLIISLFIQFIYPSSSQNSFDIDHQESNGNLSNIEMFDYSSYKVNLSKPTLCYNRTTNISSINNQEFYSKEYLQNIDKSLENTNHNKIINDMSFIIQMDLNKNNKENNNKKSNIIKNKPIKKKPYERQKYSLYSDKIK